MCIDTTGTGIKMMTEVIHRHVNVTGFVKELFHFHNLNLLCGYEFENKTLFYKSTQKSQKNCHKKFVTQWSVEDHENLILQIFA